jgi:hypothetical protein
VLLLLPYPTTRPFYNKNWRFCTSQNCVSLDGTGEWETNCNWIPSFCVFLFSNLRKATKITQLVVLTHSVRKSQAWRHLMLVHIHKTSWNVILQELWRKPNIPVVRPRFPPWKFNAFHNATEDDCCTKNLNVSEFRSYDEEMYQFIFAQNYYPRLTQHCALIVTFLWPKIPTRNVMRYVSYAVFWLIPDSRFARVPKHFI